MTFIVPKSKIQQHQGLQRMGDNLSSIDETGPAGTFKVVWP